MKQKFLQSTLGVVVSSATLFLLGTATVAAAAAGSVLANYTNHGAPALEVLPEIADTLVLDATIPDAWNGGTFTEDIIVVQGSNPIWQNETLNAIPALGAVDGVGYTNVAPNGFQGIGAGEAVIIDHDADSKYTNGPDTLLDGDGSTTDGIGTIDAAIVAGDPLAKIADGTTVVTGGFALCTNNRNTPTVIRIDTDSDCTNGTKNEGTYLLGTNATNASKVVNDKWAWADAVTSGGNGNGTYDDGEDLFKESKKNALTYSAQADTDVYSVGGINNGKNLKDFPTDCDKGGAGTQACKFTGTAPIDATDSIVIDEGTKGGAAPNSVVDKQADQLVGIAIENTGTATGDDFDAVKLWAEDGTSAGFSAAEDTLLGTMTNGTADNKHWRLGSLSTAIQAGGLRLYVTVTTAKSPTNDRTIQMQIPTYTDAGSDNAVTQETDKGTFMSSDNDGPTDAALVNPNIITVKLPPRSRQFGGGGGSSNGNTNTSNQFTVEDTTEETTSEPEETTTTPETEEVTIPSPEPTETVLPPEEVVTPTPVEPEPIVTPTPSDDEGLVLGVKVFAAGELIRGSDMRIYVINEDGTKHHILNLEELRSEHFGKVIHDVDNSILNQYPNEK